MNRTYDKSSDNVLKTKQISSEDYAIFRFQQNMKLVLGICSSRNPVPPLKLLLDMYIYYKENKPTVVKTDVTTTAVASYIDVKMQYVIRDAYIEFGIGKQEFIQISENYKLNKFIDLTSYSKITLGYCERMKNLEKIKLYNPHT